MSRLWRVDYKNSFTLIVVAPSKKLALEALLTPTEDYDPMELIEDFPYHIDEPGAKEEVIDLDDHPALELSRLYPKSWEKYVDQFVEIEKITLAKLKTYPHVVANMWYH